MRQHRFMIYWAYFVELLLVGIAYLLMQLFIGNNRLIGVMQNHWPIFTTVGGVLFAGGIAFLIYVAFMFDSEFGRYLIWRKADKKYLRAYQVQILLFFLAAVLPIATAFGPYVALAHISWITILYALINGFSIVQNTVGLIQLRQKFLSEVDVRKVK